MEKQTETTRKFFGLLNLSSSDPERQSVLNKLANSAASSLKEYPTFKDYARDNLCMDEPEETLNLFEENPQMYIRMILTAMISSRIQHDELKCLFMTYLIYWRTDDIELALYEIASNDDVCLIKHLINYHLPCIMHLLPKFIRSAHQTKAVNVFFEIVPTFLCHVLMDVDASRR